MNARKMFAVLTLAIAMFFTVAANAQTTKPAPKTDKKPAASTGEKKPMGHKKGHKKSHHKKSHKKSSGKKSSGTGTTKPAPKKS